MNVLEYSLHVFFLFFFNLHSKKKSGRNLECVKPVKNKGRKSHYFPLVYSLPRDKINMEGFCCGCSFSHIVFH